MSLLNKSQFDRKWLQILRPSAALRRANLQRALPLAGALGMCWLTAGCNHEPLLGQRSTTHLGVNDRREPGTYGDMTKLEFTMTPDPMLAGQMSLWSLKVLYVNPPPGEPEYERSFDQDHTNLLNLIVVSRDLSHFERLKSAYEDYGHFLAEVTLPHAGQYKMYADYIPYQHEREVAQRIVDVQGTGIAPSPVAPALTPDSDKDGWITKTVAAQDEHGAPTNDRYQVALMPMPSHLLTGDPMILHFQVRDATGRPLTDLQPYLGALGHCFAISENTQIYLHPLLVEKEGAENAQLNSGPDVQFTVRFPKPGIYVAWPQFEHNGHVITVRYVLKVEAGTDATPTPISPLGKPIVN